MKCTNDEGEALFKLFERVHALTLGMMAIALSSDEVTAGRLVRLLEGNDPTELLNRLLLKMERVVNEGDN